MKVWNREKLCLRFAEIEWPLVRLYPAADSRVKTSGCLNVVFVDEVFSSPAVYGWVRNGCDGSKAHSWGFLARPRIAPGVNAWAGENFSARPHMIQAGPATGEPIFNRSPPLRALSLSIAPSRSPRDSP